MSIAQDANFVAEPEEFWHAVGDVDHRQAAKLQLFNKGEKILRVGFGERTGGFIKNENARIRANGRGDLHKLLLRGREGAHGLGHVERDADGFE